MPQTIFFPTKDIWIERKTSKNPMSMMHHHNTYEIYYTLSGEREYFVENRFFKVQDGDFVLIPKNMLHRTAGKGADRILIYFSDEFLKKYFSDRMIDSLLSNFEPKIFRHNEENEQKSKALISAFFTAYGTSCDETLLASYLFQILFLLNSSENVAQKNADAHPRLQEILRYLNEHFDTITGIEEIAERFYISKYHLCRLFTKEMGMTLIEYLNTVKIRTACDRIRSGEDTMTDIAMRCGFNSSAYFCKVFKQETGLSPREYKALFSIQK